MSKKKGPLQKISYASGIVCFLLAIATGVVLYLQPQVVDKNDPVTASLAATMFFFVCIGIVLGFIGKADIPSFKFDQPDDQA